MHKYSDDELKQKGSNAIHDNAMSEAIDALVNKAFLDFSDGSEESEESEESGESESESSSELESETENRGKKVKDSRNNDMISLS